MKLTSVKGQREREAKGTLILISGPIASGKTTLAGKLAASARSLGMAAASIDMDFLTEMVGGEDWSLIEPMHRELACRLASSLVDVLFQSGVRVAAVAGSTLAQDEWQRVVAALTTQPSTVYILLRVSTPEAIRRAQADASRVITRNPDVVARLADRIDWSRTRSPDIEIHTDGLGADQVLAAVRDKVFAGL